ncbi:MAG: M15 family metallopeptidase [Cyanobacteria bacterium P01_D01_bin.1]
MLSKLFDIIPRRYRFVAIATVTAVSIPLIGLTVYLTFLNTGAEPAELARTDVPSLPAQDESTSLEPSELIITPVPTSPESDNPKPNGLNSVSPTIAEAKGSLEPVQNLPQLEEYAQQYEPVTKYNHFSYDEAYGGDIESIGMFTREFYKHEEYLHHEAAAAFKQMKTAAAADSIKLQAISGFRTIARQSALFQDQVVKLGSEAAAAKISAPPGHSEHHTGYAVDIGDLTLPNADITYDFQNTPAYSWLLTNAHRYGFEQSFPRNNLQGVSFEPWHWRYVGSEAAIEVFARGRADLISKD